MLLLLATGCSRVDTLRLAHANGGTAAEWPPGERSLEFDLVPSADGRPWVPVVVDGRATVPFLLQASAGAIALTGARADGFGPFAAGSITLRPGLLPGIAGGLLVKQRGLALGLLVLGEQSLLLVDRAQWPHQPPQQAAAGVLGYDLFRRFTVELDLAAQKLRLYRPATLGPGGMTEVRRLAVLRRIPYFEAWLEAGNGAGRWLRLEFEPGHAGGLCLDEGQPRGHVTIAGQRVDIEPTPCPASDSTRRGAGRDGVLGAGVLGSLVVAVDYSGGRIGFRPVTERAQVNSAHRLGHDGENHGVPDAISIEQPPVSPDLQPVD
jgi:hypothetical protein